MDWVRDVYGISGADLDNLYRYGDGEATVLKFMENDKSPYLWSIGDYHELFDWGLKERPKLNDIQAGLVLLVLKHTGEHSFPLTDKTDSDTWLKKYQSDLPPNEKTPRGQSQYGSGAKRSLKALPFSRTTFELASELFYMHGSISRAISRADVPVFSRTRVTVNEEKHDYDAWVYNTRTTNAWESDHAATITYFPHNGLTFGVIFGCKFQTEAEIIKRLTLSAGDALHPLIVPGILVELERKRHVNLARKAISELETRIYQLNPSPDTREVVPQKEIERLHREKRSSWLDMTYLKNCLISWSGELDNFKLFLAEIDARKSGSQRPDLWWKLQDDTASPLRIETVCGQCMHIIGPENSTETSVLERSPTTPSQVDGTPNSLDAIPACVEPKTYTTIKETSFKIRARVHSLLKEYEDLILDCTMRIDGMSMATQWAQGETNMEIAKATSRDSKHMRSISLVTMVFLPGTFFAGLFSTSFFSWQDGDDQPKLSNYFWVYILITVIFTILTLGLWYYFNVFRHSIGRKKAEDAQVTSFV